MRRRDLVVPSLSAAVALSLVLVGVSPVQEDEPRAPDGRPALAGRGNAQELGRVLVRPRTAEEKEWVGSLFGLEAAVELRLALAARKLRERGCMGFVEDPATETLTDQIARFDELASRGNASSGPSVGRGSVPKPLASLDDMTYERRGC